MAADIAARGFYDDPVMSWVFPDPASRLDQLLVTFGLLARRYHAQGRVILLEEVSVSFWTPPAPPPGAEVAGDQPEPDAPTLAELFDAGVVQRFGVLGEAMDGVHPTDRHWYLGVLSTLPQHQGQGWGARNVAPVLELCDGAGIPSYLESTNRRNLTFYQRHGWVQTDEVRLPEGPALYPMWREPVATG